MTERPQPIQHAGPRWQRIRWSDDDPMPSIGQRISLGLTGEDGQTVVSEVQVLDAQMDFEPGWCQVQVRPAP